LTIQHTFDHDLTCPKKASENNDFCSACGGTGYLLCCDGCDRSFHFSCLDPPISDDAKELDEPWYCFVCIVAKRPFADSPEKPTRGLFAPLLNVLKKKNPTNFTLPLEIRDYFEGVAADKNGNFVESVSKTTRYVKANLWGKNWPHLTRSILSQTSSRLWR
jgi:hypothetical protein